MKNLCLFVAVTCAAFGITSIASAQLAPVDVGAGVSWPVVGLLAVVGVVIVGLIYWHRKNPTQEAAALAAAHSDMAMIANKAHDALAGLIAKMEPPKTAPQATPAAGDGVAHAEGAENTVAAVPGPSAEQLAAVAAARKAYDDALAAAGVMVSTPPAA